MKVLPISVIILTYNESSNIQECLESISGWVSEIWVVDSGSTDTTIEISKNYTTHIVLHPFENYSQQRNWALDNLPISNKWILQMDADHRVSSELKKTLLSLFRMPISESISGFLVSRRTIFMGKWIRWGGHYPVYHAILFLKGRGYCEEKLYDQHFKVNGVVKTLKGDMIDVFAESLTSFTERHNKWSTLEAEYQCNKNDITHNNTIDGKLWGNAIEKRRYLKSIYESLPLFIRPFVYFFIRYFFRLGFLDGRQGLIFHFLQGFWFRFLVDAKIFQIKHIAQKTGKPIQQVLVEDFGVNLSNNS